MGRDVSPVKNSRLLSQLKSPGLQPQSQLLVTEYMTEIQH